MSSSKRTLNFSEGLTESDISATLRAEFTNQLSAELDRQRDEELIRQLDISKNSSPETTLTRLLSLRSVVSTASLSATFHQSQKAGAAGYRSIGFGQCGLVFERPGRNYAIKVAKPSYESALWADLQAHFRIRLAFEQQQEQNDMECRVPRIFSFVPKDNKEWWDKNLPLFPDAHDAHDAFPLPAMALITERILPLPKIARQALIYKFCPASIQDTVRATSANRDCLGRVYLGRRRPTNAPPTPNFTLRNYNLTLDQMLELDLPVKLYATAIADALAIIHWAANVDAYDIEFVLGGEGDVTYTRDMSQVLKLTVEQMAAMPPYTDLESMMAVNFRRRTTRMWVLDFNLCNSWEEKTAWEHPETLVEHLVMSFFENDPYYPLPLPDLDIDKELWEVFSMKYLERAGQILKAPGKDKRLTDLPRRFIDACVERERRNIALGLGHGHREHKG